MHISFSKLVCTLFCRRDGESARHLFLHCNFSREIWDHLFSNLNRYWVMPRKMIGLFAQWNLWGLGDRGWCFWACLIHAVLWGIWKEKNLRIFEGRSKSSNGVIDSIIREVGSWIFVSKEFQGLSLFSFVRDWVTCISLNSPVVRRTIVDWHPLLVFLNSILTGLLKEIWVWADLVVSFRTIKVSLFVLL